MPDQRWTATYNSKFGAAIWYDGRIMFRVVAGAEDSRITSEDPVPQWQKCVDAILDRMNRIESAQLRDAARLLEETRRAPFQGYDFAERTRQVMREIQACTPGARLADVPTLFAFEPIERALKEIANLAAPLDAVPSIEGRTTNEKINRHGDQ